MPISTAKLLTYIIHAKRALDAARIHGDQLQIDLAEAALNDLLDELRSPRRHSDRM
jgi:hypothetical protein